MNCRFIYRTMLSVHSFRHAIADENASLLRTTPNEAAMIGGRCAFELQVSRQLLLASLQAIFRRIFLTFSRARKRLHLCTTYIRLHFCRRDLLFRDIEFASRRAQRICFIWLFCHAISWWRLLYCVLKFHTSPLRWLVLAKRFRDASDIQRIYLRRPPYWLLEFTDWLHMMFPFAVYA